MITTNFYAQDAQGNILPGADVFVYLTGTTTLATGLTTALGAALANPFKASATAQIQFKAPDGNYDVRVKSGARESTLRGVQIVDSLARFDTLSSPQGAGSIGWELSALNIAIGSAGQLISAQMPNIWAFQGYITSRPDPLTPSTWDWTPAYAAAQVVFSAVYTPRGTYRATIRQTVDGLCLLGEGNSSIIQLIGNVGIYDYVGADNSAPSGRSGMTVHNLKILGPYTNPDDFSSPANSWALASGLSKDLTDTSIVGIRLKRSSGTTFINVTFSGLHVGIDQYGGIYGTIWRCTFENGKIGYRCQNGASWGDASYKTTTITVHKNFFRTLWIGMYLNEWVDDCRSYENIFEPVNTATYALNGGSARGTCLLADYYERCYEGVVFNGGSQGRWTMRDPYFAGTPGNFWGYGKSIDIQVGTGASFRLFLETNKIGGGGFRNLSAGRVYADSLEAVSGNLFDTLYLTKFVNKPINPDPLLKREGRLIDWSTGITSKAVETDTDGSTVLAFTGSGGGLASNGLRFLLTGKRSGPVRLKMYYKYTGTSVNFKPFGIFLGSPYSSHIGPTVAGDTGGEWVEADITVNHPTADYAFAYAQGGFDGVFRMKIPRISEGYGLPETYTANPSIIPDNAIPSTGKGEVSDRAPKMIAAVGSAKAWTCTVAGSPGTWVSEGNL